MLVFVLTAIASFGCAEESKKDVIRGTQNNSSNTGDSNNSSQPSAMVINIVSPQFESQTAAGDSIRFEAAITREARSVEGLVAKWRSNKDGELAEQVLGADGRAVINTTTLSSGIHQVRVSVVDEDETTHDASVTLGVCGWTPVENFNDELDSAMWLQLGSAARNSCGWLELTGNSPDKKGAFYNIGRSLNPGSLKLRFRVSTGQCAEDSQCNLSSCGSEGGADGFALSVIDVDALDLETIFADALTGGGLGYGINGPYGDNPVAAFHLEFDTWHNVYNGTTQLHTDPTEDDHVEITLNGDPSNSQAYASMANLEDNLWHDIEISIQGPDITIWVDGVQKIQHTIPDYQFKGGLIGFSGTTGAYTNFHRIDDLELSEQCEFD